MTLTLRSVKGSKLTIAEMDNNLTYLETSGGTASGLITGGTVGQFLSKINDDDYNVE
jgi:hypothetical protein